MNVIVTTPVVSNVNSIKSKIILLLIELLVKSQAKSEYPKVSDTIQKKGKNGSIHLTV